MAFWERVVKPHLLACTMMKTTARRVIVFGLFICMLRGTHGADNFDRRATCESLERCLNTNMLCPVLYSHYNCFVYGRNSPVEPACGESTLTGSASDYPMPRVVGGVDVVENEFPWTVHVSDSQAIISFCGGVILNKDTVLTAAHCVDNIVNRPETLRIGYGSSWRPSFQYVNASNILVHPFFNPMNNDNDLAIVTLSSSLPLSESSNLRAICLPDSVSSSPSASSRCLINGWGLTAALSNEDNDDAPLISTEILLSENGNTIPNRLQKARVPIIDQAQCIQAYAGNERVMVSERQRCAGYIVTGASDACQADSGGPLFCPEGRRWVVYGIISSGSGCGQPGFPGVYAYVPYHLNWIRANMAMRN